MNVRIAGTPSALRCRPASPWPGSRRTTDAHLSLGKRPIFCLTDRLGVSLWHRSTESKCALFRYFSYVQKSTALPVRLGVLENKLSAVNSLKVFPITHSPSSL